jgi:hypothetical protein
VDDWLGRPATVRAIAGSRPSKTGSSHPPHHAIKLARLNDFRGRGGTASRTRCTHYPAGTTPLF